MAPRRKTPALRPAASNLVGNGNYSQEDVDSRRAAQNKRRFRRQLGALAAVAAIVLPAVAVGGARPGFHDAERGADAAADAVRDRIAMIQDAFSGGGDQSGPHAEINRAIAAQRAKLAAERAAEAHQNDRVDSGGGA